MEVRRVLRSRHSIFFSWLLSYILILLIPVAFTGIVYLITVSTIEKETNRANLALLKQVRLNMDNILKDAERLCFDINFNPRIQSLTNSLESKWVDEQYTVFELVKEFKRMNVTNGYIKNFYVYFKNLDAVISPQTASRSRLMHSILGHEGDIQLEKWIEMLQDKHMGSYSTISDKKENNKSGKTIAYMRSIPISNPEKAIATIVVLLNEARFMEMIQNIQGANYGDIFIMDKNNDNLASTATYNLSDILKSEELWDSNMILKRIGNESVIISYTQSEVSELKYVSIVPRKIVMERIDYTRNLMCASIILCLVIGGAISILITLRNYNPLRELVNTLQGGSEKSSYYKSFNEYSFIQQAIQNQLEERKKINKKLEKQDSVVKADFLRKLLKGKAGCKISIHDAFYNLDIQFASNDFAVLLISIEEKGKTVYSEAESDLDEEQKLVSFIVINVFNEMFKKNFKGFITEIDEKITCLINLKEVDGLDGMQELIRISEEAQQFLRKYYEMIITVSISDIQQNINGIATAYQEAAEAMEYKMVVGNGNIICFQNVKNSVRNYFYPLEKEQKLMNCIKSGEFEKGKELLDDIFASNFDTIAPTIAMTRCLMFDIASTIVKTVQEISVTEPVEKLLECKTVAELQKEITNTLWSVCNQVQANMSNRVFELSRNVKEFIEAHYQDINLNIAMVAEKFQITPAYISKLFKEQTGEGLLDYINKVRLKKAKSLLKGERMSISDTATKVGYLNSNALIRSFKKYEGVTPGQYKGIES